MKILSNIILVLFAFVSTSCLNQENGQYIPGVNGPKINIQGGKVLLSLELTNINLDVGLTLPIPKMKNTEVTVGPSIGGTGTLIKVAFDLNDVNSDSFKIVSPQYLPDGRPFPFLVDGSLPALSFNLPKVRNTTFYISKKVFGFFLPINVPKDFNVNVFYRIKINGKKYGVVSLIHPDASGAGGGVIVLLTLDDIRNNTGAMNLIKRSKRNKSRLY